jgi:hypothetical protein
MFAKAVASVVSIVLCLMLVSSAAAFPPATWNDGDEEDVFGHGFDEEYWTNESFNATSPAGDDVTFSASFVNHNNVQAFLLSLNMVENDNGTGTVPFQLFGMHYVTPEGREVFIAAVLAFLMAFDDTYNGTGPGQNGVPDPGNEIVYYIIPFGLAAALDEVYPPEVEPQPVEKLGEGHYRFGIQYRNLYAFVSPNFVASLAYSTGWIAKFSELTVVYEITMDEENGEVRAETWYTIGEVTELWMILFGIPIPADPHNLPENLGISAVHFVTVFTSKYQGASQNSTGSTINTAINTPIDEDIVLKIGEDSERAMKIGTRGTFDLINETTEYVIKDDEPAMNAIVGARLVDVVLVGWQLGFAAGAMSIFAYALSDHVQSVYDGPLDLAQRSMNPLNSDGFNAQPLWYAVSFPQWNGYRVVHDPVYTAYTSFEAPGDENGGLASLSMAGLLLLLLIVVAVIVIVVVVGTRDKK